MFYQKFWSIVGIDVCNSSIVFLNGGFMLKEMNKTFISLILKIPNPEKPEHYRPMSLCNVAYKISSKVLANRLRDVMPFLI